LRKYQVPGELIRFGEKNVIAVRVYDAQLDGGIIAGDLKIYSNGFLPRFDINLAGEWQFNKGRSYNESSARPIHVPGAWENQGYFGYDGYAVYAKKIDVSNELASQRLVLLAGRIDDADMLYINGKYIGQTGKFGENNGNIYREFRNYFLPPNTLKPGENLIEIKVYDSGGNGGIYEGPIGIMTQNKFREYWKAKRRN
jgi:sialate O-acetylesterase